MKKLIYFLCMFMVFSINNSFGQGCEEASDDDKPKIFGYLQPQYEYHFNGDSENDIDNENYFKFKRVRLGVMGNIPYDFFYYVTVENSAFVSKTGNPYLLDAFISYKRFEWAKVSIGSFKQPFGLEVSTPCHGLHTIQRSLASDQFVSPQRDMGLMITGGNKETKLFYAMAFMNGRGLGVADNNAQKDYIGRITYKPFEFLRIGGSFRYGFPNNKDNDRMSYAGELEFKKGNLLVQGEYIYDEGDYNRAAGGGCGAEPLTLLDKRNGAFAQALYMTPWNIQPVVKWEYMDIDTENDETEYYITTFGINYWFNDWTRFQLNYQYAAETEKEVKNDAILIQMQIKF